MRARRKSHNQHAGIHITKTGHGERPVIPIHIRAPFRLTQRGAIFPQTRATCAGNNLFIQNGEIGSGGTAGTYGLLELGWHGRPHDGSVSGDKPARVALRIRSAFPEQRNPVSSSYDGEKKRKKRFSLASSGLLTALILAVVLGILGAVWVAHLHGRLHKLSTAEIPPDNAVLPRPGGQDVIEVHRISPASGVTPQFVGLTVMPGVGMGILQLSLDLPGRDTHDLLVGTPITSMGPMLQPKTGALQASLKYSPISLKVFPLTGDSKGQEILGTQPAQDARDEMTPGGAGASGDFSATPAPGPDGSVPPPSGIQTKVTATISDRGYDLSIAAKNVSDQAKSVVLSWTPQFAVPEKGLSSLHITPPETAENAERATEISLDTPNFHRTWQSLKYSYLSSGPELRLRNLADAYTLRLMALTPSIRNFRVDVPQDGNAVSVTFSTEGPDGAKTVIGPGETLQWHVKIQVAPNNSYSPTSN